MSESFNIEVELPGGTVRPVECGADEYIIDAARRAGLKLPSLCEQGWCINCAARIIEGEADHSDALRYYGKDRNAGFALLCTAKPRSDMRIVSHQTQAMRRHRDAAGLPAPRGT